MKIAIFSPYATVAPHFETELELAQRHLDDGHQVEIVSCHGELANCDFNPRGEAARCQACLGRRQAGLSMLEPRPDCGSLGSAQWTLESGLQTQFDTVAELTQYKIDNFDIGYAVLSSLVSQIRDPEPDLRQHASTIEKFMRSAAQTYEFTLDYLHRSAPDRVYTFNGRFASMRAVLRACQKTGTSCWLHERGCDGQHFELFKNHLPHDIDAIDAEIRRIWNAAGVEANSTSSREQIGAQWFLDRVNRVETSWHSFTKHQQTGLLPNCWDSRRKNVAIFCSSDDEFVAIGDAWRHSLYSNQVEAIGKIANSMLTADPACQLYLRVHPNLTNVQNERKRQMLALTCPNLTVIQPDAPIDTYQLMCQSDVVVSFGSSVGIEAVFWNRPSILLGPCFYQNLGGTYRPATHSEAVNLIVSDLDPGDKTGALMYGHWLQTRGQKYNYYQAEGLFEGKFKGQHVYAGADCLNQPKSLFQKLQREAMRLVRHRSRAS